MFSTFDRYLLRSFLKYFFSALLFVCALFVVADGMSLLARFESDLSVLIKYYGLSLPAIAYQMLPVACLVASVFTLSELNRTNEIVALFSLGYDIYRIAMPILVVVGMIGVVGFVVGDQIVPRANQRKNYVYYVDIRKRPGLYSTVKDGKIWYRSKDILFNIQSVDEGTRSAKNLTMYFFDPTWNLSQTIRAESVQIFADHWNLEEGSVTVFGGKSGFPMTKAFDKKVIKMEKDAIDLSERASADVLRLSELRKYIERNKQAGLETTAYEVDYHSKFAFTFASLLLSLLGIPFAVGHARTGGGLKSVAICIGLVLAYWSVHSSGITLGKHGMLPPFFGAWGANLLSLMIFVALIVRRRLV